MDCPAEEGLVRMALEGVSGIERLEFDLAARTLSVWHSGPAEVLRERLAALKLGARLAASGEASLLHGAGAASPGAEARTLRAVLAINGFFFVVEIVAGWLAESTGLMADGADMLADALVYGVALYAVGRTLDLKVRAARLCGWLQLVLALAAFAEVARRALAGSEPEPPAMIGVSLLALAANVTSLWLLTPRREGGVHLKATYICTANDVLANLGVISAGALVAWTGSRLPDLLIATAVALLILQGALRILRLEPR